MQRQSVFNPEAVSSEFLRTIFGNHRLTPSVSYIIQKRYQITKGNYGKIEKDDDVKMKLLHFIVYNFTFNFKISIFGMGMTNL
jgi:hypothetical protein